MFYSYCMLHLFVFSLEFNWPVILYKWTAFSSFRHNILMFARFMASLLCFLFIFYFLMVKKWYLQIWCGILISSGDKHNLNKVNDIFIKRKKHILTQCNLIDNTGSHCFEKLLPNNDYMFYLKVHFRAQGQLIPVNPMWPYQTKARNPLKVRWRLDQLDFSQLKKRVAVT